MPRKTSHRTTTSSHSRADPAAGRGTAGARKATPKPERIQKVLAHAGLGSRREIDTWVDAGRIKVNGRVAVAGDRIGPRDRIHVDGREVFPFPGEPSRARVIACNKPAGEICIRRDPRGRPTVFDRLPPLATGRWVAVGRLDMNSSGLLLFTDDGELAHSLAHPSKQVEREYAVRVLGTATPAQLDALCRGVALEDGPARFLRILDAGGEGANHWYHVTIGEGRNREVRGLWASQGLTVSRLICIRYGAVSLPRSLRAGQVRELPPREIAALAQSARGGGRRRPVHRPGLRK